MVIEIENTKADFIHFYRSYYLEKLTKWSILIVLLILIFSYNISLEAFEWKKFILTVLVLLFLSFGLFFWFPYLISIKRIKTSSPLFERRVIKMLTEGMQIDSLSGNFLWRWEDIVDVLQTADFFYFTTGDRKSELIPKRFFSSEIEAASFFESAKSKLKRNNQKNDNRSIYKWGLLGFIPLVGFFSGTILLLKGIFKYKDKKMVIIGLAGMLFTVAIYAFLFYNLRYGKTTANNLTIIAQEQLNDLAGNIEIYKLKTGGYPDSLEQLKVYDKMVILSDPLLVRMMNDKIGINFCYQKLSEGYKLYSVGVDGLANTADDIYPQMLDSNTIK